MSRRINLARGLIKLGAFIQSLAVMVMKPGDLSEFSRQSYASERSINDWSGESCLTSGLYADELALLDSVPVKTGRLLLLGVGGGREAIPLARMGFQVTGLDFVAGMVERARHNAAQRGMQIEGLVQNFANLDVPRGAYDVVWMSRAMYSCVPTRAQRVQLVTRIANALKPGGFFLCQFQTQAESQPSRKATAARRLFAALTLGNTAYEPGDLLLGNIEFIHEFFSDAAVQSEIEEGGLRVVRFQPGPNHLRRGVVCEKSPVTG